MDAGQRPARPSCRAGGSGRATGRPRRARGRARGTGGRPCSAPDRSPSPGRRPGSTAAPSSRRDRFAVALDTPATSTPPPGCSLYGGGRVPGGPLHPADQARSRRPGEPRRRGGRRSGPPRSRPDRTGDGTIEPPCIRDVRARTGAPVHRPTRGAIHEVLVRPSVVGRPPPTVPVPGRVRASRPTRSIVGARRGPNAARTGGHSPPASVGRAEEEREPGVERRLAVVRGAEPGGRRAGRAIDRRRHRRVEGERDLAGAAEPVRPCLEADVLGRTIRSSSFWSEATSSDRAALSAAS